MITCTPHQTWTSVWSIQIIRIPAQRQTLPRKSCGLSTLWRTLGDGSLLHGSMPLCSHSCCALCLWEAQRHSHCQGQHLDSQLHPYYFPHLCFLLFIGLCFLLFIGQPNTATCILQQTTFHQMWSLCLLWLFPLCWLKLLLWFWASRSLLQGEGWGSCWYQEYLTSAFSSPS